MSKVCLLIGQSNAVGNAALAANLNSPWTGLGAAYSNVQFSSDTGWPTDPATAPSHSTGAWTDLQSGTHSGAGGDMGPELQLGRVLDAYESGQWRIVKSALGSTTLEQWRPGRKLEHELYTRTKTVLDTRLAQGGTHTLNGVAWIHGTNDAATLALGKDYANKLVNLIRTIRSQYGATLPFVFNQLHKDCLNTSGLRQVREGQAAVAAALSNVSMVNMDDVTISLNHFDQDGYCVLGDRLGDALVALL